MLRLRRRHRRRRRGDHRRRFAIPQNDHRNVLRIDERVEDDGLKSRLTIGQVEKIEDVNSCGDGVEKDLAEYPTTFGRLVSARRRRRSVSVDGRRGISTVAEVRLDEDHVDEHNRPMPNDDERQPGAVGGREEGEAERANADGKEMPERQRDAAEQRDFLCAAC